MEADLADMVEGDFAYPVTIKGGPDGLSYSTSASDPTKPLMAFIQMSHYKESSEGLGAVVVQEQVVILRISSCPAWLFAQPLNPFEVIYPENPTSGAPVVSHLVDGAKAMEVNRTLGTVRIYPKRAAQK
jgi:hypothetical protein